MRSRFYALMRRLHAMAPLSIGMRMSIGGGGWGSAVPSNAILDRADNAILDRSGGYILTRT